MTSETADVKARGSRRYWWVAGALVLAAGGAAFGWIGSHRAAPVTVLRPMIVPASAGAAPHPMGNDQISAVVQRLADRLAQQPGDAQGWAMLARSYANLGRHGEALAAYAKALELRTDDAAVLADYADELALHQGRRVTGEPMTWVRRALALEPRQPKALLLAGTEAFERTDYAQAIRHWSQVVQGGRPGSDLVMQAQAGLDDARRLAGAGARILK